MRDITLSGWQLYLGLLGSMFASMAFDCTPKKVLKIVRKLWKRRKTRLDYVVTLAGGPMLLMLAFYVWGMGFVAFSFIGGWVVSMLLIVLLVLVWAGRVKLIRSREKRSAQAQ